MAFTCLLSVTSAEESAVEQAGENSRSVRARLEVPASRPRQMIGTGIVAVALVALLGSAEASPRVERASLGVSAAAKQAPFGQSARTSERQARAAYAKLPLSFVPNAGQLDGRVRYLAQAGGASFYFTQREVVFSFAVKRQSVVLRLGFLDANPQAAIAASRRQGGRVNYLLGSDPARWRTNLPTYDEVVYRELWPGVDLHFRGAASTLKYEFHVRPGADPSVIRLAYDGARGLSLDRAGNLRIATPLGVLTDSRPSSFQPFGGRRVAVASRYLLAGARGYRFDIGRYDDSRRLVIDPGLAYSTFLGGTTTENGSGIAVDGAGNAYVSGLTTSPDYPTTSGAYDQTHNGGSDAFVSKLNPAGSALVYSTFLGGSAAENGVGVAVDGAGNAYVSGLTSSPDFPTTPGAFDEIHNGSSDAYVSKLNPAGSALVYSTLLGGTATDQTSSIAVDGAGNAHVSGETTSPNYPTTAGAFDEILNGASDAFVTKLNAAGSALVYSTFLGGTATDQSVGIALDSAGVAHVTGLTASPDYPTTAGAYDQTHNGAYDAFVTRLNAIGSAPDYSTFLGGAAFDLGFSIAIDGAGSAYVTGNTNSPDYPTTPGAHDQTHDGANDAFVTKLNALGSALLYSTLLGGTTEDQGADIAVDGAGNAYVNGLTTSPEYPTTPGAHDQTFNGITDIYVSKLNPAGSALVYSTFLGGTAADQASGLAVDAAGNAYVTGITGSPDYPTTAGAFDETHNGVDDAFVTKLATIATPVVATITLSPVTAINPVGTTHTVTARVSDDAGRPVSDVVVRFTVTGAHMLMGACATGPNGQCTFAYTGTQAGTDAIAAYADSNNDHVQDLGEPTGEASKIWTPPTPGCPPKGGDDDEDDDGLENGDESVLGTLLGNADSDGDGRRDGNDDSDDDGRADEDEDDGTEDECPNDSDGDHDDDEDEDDD